MAPLLPEDVMIEIFDNLTGDANTLFSGLLVNKLWCRVIIPILWRDPWEIARLRQKIKAYNFLYVLCGCLSEESKNLFLDLGLNFQIHYPKFDYASYIRMMNTHYFNVSITKKFCSKDRDNIKRQLVEKELYLLIISRSPAIKYLRIEFPTTLEYPILSFPGANTSFSKLNKFFCDAKRLPRLFLIDLANISKNIQQIYAKNFDVDETGIAKLIKAQTRLAYFHLESGGACNGNGMTINKELESLAPSLKHFVVTSPHLPISVTSLYSCSLLETLKLIGKGFYDKHPTNLNRSLTNSSADAKFPNLRTLYIRSTYAYHPITEFKIAENFVARSGGQLHSLFLQGKFKKEHVKPSLLQNVAKCCPKLKFLSVWLTNDDDIRYLEQILSSCSSLRGIIVNTFIDVKIGDELLMLFKRRLARKLCKFKFNDHFHFSQSSFVAFMNSWSDNDSLQIHVIDEGIFAFDYGRVCTPFNERGVLKSLIGVDEFTSFSWEDTEGEDLLLDCTASDYGSYYYEDRYSSEYSEEEEEEEEEEEC
ncbi:uncharacterized protein OCT59_007720 [Rhizophagus irregularis]|uniref:Uncharacterized protein n=2 Tax=Rhizophagus irregularis TaxID=588596 RepID=A0A015JR47_RHIIW|nr:hypothetical protein GLOIN_2v1549971 [Rhizophagus irregularis DAOM 181602=DAOM 197198]EXX69755.1 hypothetical protein RirG_093420 [Rhizophagus irregularis DAOM 197198w]UZO16331.1 hypothetical protein OCT59_007720 [Rhizophagus irregularis]POG77180.1 hypothetical protein GLOIN_2v1549971 [Rhizophagus irregularis DAOM 181602=DAOM 197198]CAB4399077.1 unnamed protein product [Rhizophagus irregularis]CAB5378638.1 unnamed protein product [Rhizophagus irregularis]|eukprot:XP_025184046.1 hypothetical protein GLOIN_2v1549971 [Rhizophagus irregularis DAOM 181602=DAOM 197198]